MDVSAVVERKNWAKYKEGLAKRGLTEEKLAEFKAKIKRDDNGRYIFDKSQPLGSIYNPIEVGLAGVSVVLVFDWKKEKWLLTDGLGNGWVR